MNKQTFEEYLRKRNLAQSTIISYMWGVKYFLEHYKEVNNENLLAYKGYLLEAFKPRTVNLRLQAINSYLSFLGENNIRLKQVRIQQRNYLENVISNADYQFFKAKLKEEGNLFWYFVLSFLGATGARVSELVQIKVEHIKAGYMDIYGKGGKVRRVYIPNRLKKEVLKWLNSKNQSCGYIFKNRFGKIITPRGIAFQLKKLARKYGIDEKVVYPHSFRHLFAKNFLEICNDIALLADLMGHESIETTRIYLRKSAAEQYEILNKVVLW